MKRTFLRSIVPHILFTALFFGWLLLEAIPEAQAQSEIARFLGPDIGFLKTTLNFQAGPYHKEEVPGQSKELSLNRFHASLLLPLAQNETEEWGLTGNFRGQDIKTEAVLPDARRKFPGGLWDVRLGPFSRHRFKNGWIGGGSLTLGSASDRPFAGMEETELQATGFVRIPDGERNAWIVLLTYSNNREFLNNVPLPGIAYSYQPSDLCRILVGFPFAFFELKPYRDVSLELSYFLVRSFRGRISYRFLRPLGVYGGFEWRNESYFLIDRQDRWDRFFYYEKRVYAGVRWDLSKQIFVDLSAGYAFDRFYFEGKGYEDRDHNRVEVKDGPFFSVQTGFRF